MAAKAWAFAGPETAIIGPTAPATTDLLIKTAAAAANLPFPTGSFAADPNPYLDQAFTKWKNLLAGIGALYYESDSIFPFQTGLDLRADQSYYLGKYSYGGSVQVGRRWIALVPAGRSQGTLTCKASNYNISAIDAELYGAPIYAGGLSNPRLVVYERDGTPDSKESFVSPGSLITQASVPFNVVAQDLSISFPVTPGKTVVIGTDADDIDAPQAGFTSDPSKHDYVFSWHVLIRILNVSLVMA